MQRLQKKCAKIDPNMQGWMYLKIQRFPVV
jgi:hypothetical protein